MIQPNGTITDSYLNFGSDSGREGPESRVGENAETDTAPAAAPVGDLMVARTSRDGGAHWSAEVPITHDAGEGPAGIRCCLPSATADPRTGRLYAAWDSATPGVVALSSSRDGRHWSAPVRVNREAGPGLDHVNVDVAAEGGRVYVSYGTRDTTVRSGRFVQQRVSVSTDGGAHFRPPLSLGRCPTWPSPRRPVAGSPATTSAALSAPAGSTWCGPAPPHHRTRPPSSTRPCGPPC